MSMHQMLPAMVVLIVPSFVICVAITMAAWKRRNGPTE
jgi:hypothetical protein